MPDPDEKPPPPIFEAAEASRIYLLPNLMTAGNLFCGFLAVIRCIQANHLARTQEVAEALGSVGGRLAAVIPPGDPGELYGQAVVLILFAVVFDSLDGRLARLGGRESLFGKEFDSIADIVSFGIAPALMVFFLILRPTEDIPWFRQIGWLVGFVYLLCAAVRLARFNVITHPAVAQAEAEEDSSDFLGLPVPAAAGMIASLVPLLNDKDLKQLALGLPVLLLLVAYLMVSRISYPSFKKVGWQTQINARSFILILAGLALAFRFREVAIPLLFLAYIFYGLGRHLARRKASASPLGSPGEED